MSPHVLSYLRTHRRKWGLTQKDIARLVGRASSTHISRVERGLRTPSLETLIAYEIVFGIPPRSLIPNRYADIEERVLREAQTLFAELQDDRTRRGARKREFLELAIVRALSRTNLP